MKFKLEYKDTASIVINNIYLKLLINYVFNYQNKFAMDVYIIKFIII